MSHMPPDANAPEAWGLPGDLLAMLDARARAEGVSRQEALVRCLREWRHGREGRPRSVPPLSTTEREHDSTQRAGSDRTGSEFRP